MKPLGLCPTSLNTLPDGGLNYPQTGRGLSQVEWGSIGPRRVDRSPQEGIDSRAGPPCGSVYPLHTIFLPSHSVFNFYFYVYEKKRKRKELVFILLHNKFQHKNITALSISKYFWNFLVPMKLHGSHAQSIFFQLFFLSSCETQTFGKTQTFIKVQPCRI